MFFSEDKENLRLECDINPANVFIVSTFPSYVPLNEDTIEKKSNKRNITK
jgi:hypothetical protein